MDNLILNQRVNSVANPKNLIGKEFKKGQSGNPNGRPRKFATTMKDQGYKLSEINDTFQVLLSLNLEELKGVYENKDSTVLEKVVARSIQESIKKGDMKNIESILTRSFGQPKQQIEQTIHETPKEPSWFGK